MWAPVLQNTYSNYSPDPFQFQSEYISMESLDQTW